MGWVDNREDLTVDFISKDGTWIDGEPITHLENPSGEMVTVVVIVQMKHIKWIRATKNCLECCTVIDPEALLINTEQGWVLPCRECEYFSWYYDEHVGE